MSPAAMARGKASAGKKPSSGGVGSALDPSRGEDAKEQALRAECLKCYEIFTKKGALARATKELDKLVEANPQHPLVRYARVRLAHRDALDQTRPEMMEKKFEEAKKRREPPRSRVRARSSSRPCSHKHAWTARTRRRKRSRRWCTRRMP